MKGMSLPINILVIIVIAVIVLLGVVSVYFTSWSPFGESMGAEAAKSAGCRIVISNCGAPEEEYDDIIFDGSGGLPAFDVNDNGYFGKTEDDEPIDEEDHMNNLCQNFFRTDCKELCGCR